MLTGGGQVGQEGHRLKQPTMDAAKAAKSKKVCMLARSVYVDLVSLLVVVRNVGC